MVARGLTVIGTAAEDDLGRVAAMGATAIRYGQGWADRVRAVAPDGVDAVFDTSGAGVLADRAPEARAELAALAATGQLSVPIWRIYPLAQAARAHADLEAGRNHGKIILRP